MAGEAACQPVAVGTQSSGAWESLEGTWRLTLVATSGPAAGGSVEGTLILRSQDSILRRVERPGMSPVTVPVVGTADVPLEEIGAVRLGNLASTDPRQPGVSVWVSQGADGSARAVLRIGQESIRGDLLRFDGGYTALFLRQLDAGTIRGDWASGVSGPESSGHFCADRARG